MVHFGVEFACKTKICFQCAENLNDENISKEHIIPKWILRKFDLFNHSVTLPNGTPYKYKDYVTPCCKNCNGFLSRELEAPLSKTLGNGYDYFKEHIDESLLHRVFFWLATIFTKTHIKDQSLRMTLDRRGGGFHYCRKYAARLGKFSPHIHDEPRALHKCWI